MDNVSHSGFDLFAQSIKRKMNWSRRLDPFSHILRDAARPAWEKLTLVEKEEWLARSRELERTDQQRKEFMAGREERDGRDQRSFRKRDARGRSGRVRTTRNIHFRGVMEEDQDEEDVEEFEFAGAITNRFDPDPDGDVTIPAIDIWMIEKHERDKKRVAGWFRGLMRKQIVELRWLILSVQTYGRNEKECLLAEIALDEFTLQEGVLDRMTTIVSDWQVDNAILQSRAIFHANETHEIPLDHSKHDIHKVQLIGEILGRIEPTIAKQQSVSVGLYRAPKGPSSEDYLPDIDRLNVDDPDDQFISTEGRRPILILRHEYYAATESLLSFKKRMRLDYDGFPVEENRFILAEAFVEAVAEELKGEPMNKFDQFLSELGKPLDANFATQWEKKDELFCKFHAERKNACCAAVTAARAIFIMIFSLEKLIHEELF
ncbi:hypothetical protein PENTCL1PPCAC_18233 [Pristionchus entomophagus]|uniref:Maelstrom domain-containing protein n=1 Tax=Pristionchus entomophagus TaxID=358040 RepID=A0AAV5TNQ6_9BILA|nr:hypothetical protein PENTCL1PPCAC_18233 [Pristionchus entomophagus]